MSEIEFKISEEIEEKIRQAIVGIITDEVTSYQSKYGFDHTYMKKYELAKYLHLSNNTLDKLIKQGLPKIDAQGVVLYRRDLVDEWLKSRTVIGN